MTKLWRDYLRFRDGFEQAIDPQLHPIAHLDGLVWSGRALLIPGARAAIVIGAKTYPSGTRDVHGLVAAGDLEEIVETLIPRAETWGREHGCAGALIESRAGWSRLLGKHGYSQHQVTLRKEL